MVEEDKKRHQAGSFEGLGDELGESLHGYKGDSNENQSQLLPNDMMEIATQDETFEDIATDLGISIEEHERLDKQEAEQEIRRLSHEERAKFLAEQERLQNETEAQLLAKEREQQQRAQALKEKEEKQRQEAAKLPPQTDSTLDGSIAKVLATLLFVISVFAILTNLNPEKSSKIDEQQTSLNQTPLERRVEKEHSPITESAYTLTEGETIYPWTLDEFKTILVPDLPIGGYSNLTLDDFVAKYGLASKVDYERSSVTFDSVKLTYTLSETEYLMFSFNYFESRYQIFSKRYEGFENTVLTDYWKDKTGKSWSLADYYSLRKNSSYNTSDGQSLEEIVTTFGAPDTYHSSAYDASLFYSYTTILTYHLEDGMTITLAFTSKTNEVSDYRLSHYAIETASTERTETEE